MLDLEEQRRKVEELKRKILEQKKKGNLQVDSESLEQESIDRGDSKETRKVLIEEPENITENTPKSYQLEEDEDLDYRQKKEIAARKLIDETRKKVEQASKKSLDVSSEKSIKKPVASTMPSSGSVLLIQAYTQALKVAWSDGVLSKDESAILSVLRKVIGITEEEHRNLEQEVQMEIYLQAIVDSWKNGAITPEDLDRLDTLRERFNISAEEHLRLERQVRKEILRQKMV